MNLRASRFPLLFAATLLFGCGGTSDTDTPPIAPVISSFTATPSTIVAGESSTLAWTATGASSLSISQGVGVVTGSSVSVRPTSNTTYTLTATNSGGTATASATVTVTAPPEPVASVEVALSASVLDPGQSATASAVLRDASGNVLSGRTVTWTSSDPSVATVAASGVASAVGAGTARITATSEGRNGSATLVVNGVAVTGIDKIQEFLEQCPTSDPAYAQFSREFEVLVDGRPSEPPTNCIAPISTLPIGQVTDELIAAQAVRVAYHMSQITRGVLPWTALSLYDWMTANVDGINIKTAPGQLYCCDSINGKRYISSSRLDEFSRDFKRDWGGLGGTLSYFAHEIRHADPGPGHVTGCPDFPLASDPFGCDATYDLANLGSYGVAYWLHSSWATGFLNIGIGCSSPPVAEEYARQDASAANGLRGRFVTNAPAVVAPTPPYGGPCGGPR